MVSTGGRARVGAVEVVISLILSFVYATGFLLPMLSRMGEVGEMVPAFSLPITLRMLLSFIFAGLLIECSNFSLYQFTLYTRSASCLLNFLWNSAYISWTSTVVITSARKGSKGNGQKR